VRRSLSWLVLLVAGGLLLPSATDPPQPAELPPPAHHLTIRSESLTITPNNPLVFLSFSRGVTAASRDFQLSADLVELEVDAGELLQNQSFELPDVPRDTEHIVRDPGKTIAEMGYELELPNAQFKESSLRRVRAAGSVRVESEEGIVLTTEELISTDGGRAWGANGRSQLWRDDAEGNHAEMSADYLLFDSLASRALARGNIEVKVCRPPSGT
jgi:hypothetical protein